MEYVTVATNCLMKKNDLKCILKILCIFFQAKLLQKLNAKARYVKCTWNNGTKLSFILQILSQK